MDKLYYKDNINIRRAGLKIPLTPKQLQEYAKCSVDPVYFIENYVYINSLDKGSTLFKLHLYQKEIISSFQENRFSILLACRQSGKTTTTAAYLLWFTIFTPNKQVGVLAQNTAQAQEILSRIAFMLESVPFWLQPGCKAFNKTYHEYDNGSKIQTVASTPEGIRGKTLHCVFVDELAFVSNAATFYAAVFPVISSSTTSKMIVSSTPNGIGNLFHKLWEGSSARKNSNGYTGVEVIWKDVPGRDEKWRTEQMNALNDINKFKQEFENCFLGAKGCLVSSESISFLTTMTEDPIYYSDEYMDDFHIFKEPDEKSSYIMTVDVGGGVGKDYSVASVIQTSPLNEYGQYQEVARYRSNTVSPNILADIIAPFGNRYNDALIVVENNKYEQVGYMLNQEIEYENIYINPDKGDVGFNTNKKTKRYGCRYLKDIIDSKKLNIKDINTISEITNFVEKGDSYAAKTEDDNDDIVMTLVIFANIINSNWYRENYDEITHSIKKQLKEEHGLPSILRSGFKNKSEDDGFVDFFENYKRR